MAVVGLLVVAAGVVAFVIWQRGNRQAVAAQDQSQAGEQAAAKSTSGGSSAGAAKSPIDSRRGPGAQLSPKGNSESKSPESPDSTFDERPAQEAPKNPDDPITFTPDAPASSAAIPANDLPSATPPPAHSEIGSTPPEKSARSNDLSAADDNPPPTLGPQDAKPGADQGGGDKPGAGKKKAPVRPKNAKPADAGLPHQPLADGRCPACFGLCVVPNRPIRPHVHVEGQPLPKPEASVPWQFCPQCQKDRAAQELTDKEAARLKLAGDGHAFWEQKLQVQLVRAETHHVAIHAQMPAPQVLKIAQAIESLTAHLHTATRSTILTPNRPDDYDMVILWDEASYNRLLDLAPGLEPFAGIEDWGLIRQLPGFTSQKVSAFNAKRGAETPPEHMALSQFAQHQMDVATKGNGKHWLKIGFAYYSENAILKKNLVHWIRYEFNDVKIGPNWNAEVKTHASQRKLRRFADMLALDLRFFTPADHLLSYSMVSFLFRSNPERFARMVLFIGDGQESKAAIEAAYGQKLEELEAAWARWAMQQS